MTEEDQALAKELITKLEAIRDQLEELRNNQDLNYANCSEQIRESDHGFQIVMRSAAFGHAKKSVNSSIACIHDAFRTL